MRNILLLVFVFVLTGVIHGQSTSNSPYSYYGLGETGGLDHAGFGAMGNVTLTAFDSTILNYYNPATYNSLSKGVPLFSFGISSRLSNYSESGEKYFTPVSMLHHFTMAFPVKKYFGLAAGIKPYSRRGYFFTNNSAVGSDSLNYEYEGSGGTHEVFLGFSTDIIHLEQTRLAVGVNGGYVFGHIDNYRRSYLSSDYSPNNTFPIPGGVSEKKTYVSAFHYELGAYFTQKFRLKHEFRLAATFEPLQKFNADFENNLFYAGNIYDPDAYDTLNSSNQNANFTIAPSYKFGVAYILNIGAGSTQQKRKAQLAFHLNMGMTDWSQFDNPFESNGYSYQNTSEIKFGIQYIPETDLQNRAQTKFMNTLRYRIGLYNYTLPYETNDIQVKDFGTTFGIGIPITIGNAISSIDLGFSYGRRGISDRDALNESYYGLNFGVTISPDNADRWFRKRKLN